MLNKLFAAGTAALALSVSAQSAYAADQQGIDYKNYEFQIGGIVLGRHSGSDTVLMDGFGTPYLTSGDALVPSAGIEARFDADRAVLI